MEYDPAWRSKNRIGRVQNDDRADWGAAYTLFPGTVAYVWHASQFTVEVLSGLHLAGFDHRAQIIWAKQAHTFGRGHYHWQHEPCWYAVRHGESCGLGWRSEAEHGLADRDFLKSHGRAG